MQLFINAESANGSASIDSGWVEGIIKLNSLLSDKLGLPAGSPTIVVLIALVIGILLYLFKNKSVTSLFFKLCEWIGERSCKIKNKSTPNLETIRDEGQRCAFVVLFLSVMGAFVLTGGDAICGLLYGFGAFLVIFIILAFFAVFPSVFPLFWESRVMRWIRRIVSCIVTRIKKSAKNRKKKTQSKKNRKTKVAAAGRSCDKNE